MNEKTIKKLELAKVLQRLANRCATAAGKELALELDPVSDLELVKLRIAQTSEARLILRNNGMPPFGGITDIRPLLEAGDKGAVLPASELLAVGDFLRGSGRLKEFCAKVEEYIPQVRRLAKDITLLPQLEQLLNKCITDEGEVADRASDKLHSLRQKKRTLQLRVKDKLNEIIRSPATQKLLQDPIVTIRAGRYVVPVKQEYKPQFPGLVHDQSASGATLFVEPLAVVELNNALRQAEAAEKKEIELVLRQLTAKVMAFGRQLAVSQEAAARLDFIFAKGQLSDQMDAGAPEVNSRGCLRIVSGRHPLIEGAVVPVSIHLGQEFDTLVITGPNTGGKTVTLKTVGLFVLMAMCGLHLPAELGTEIAVFEQIFADIGDEQSIEQSLSTFSSHMTNIIDIVRRTDSRTLVLLDELGAGTDPTEGSALAMAILDYLHQQGARTVATTHYSELKAYAYSTESVENASVEFDVETLRPTYRLMIGVPGGSNAFEIAVRLGLPRELVQRARRFLSSEQVKVADLIQSLEENQRVSDHERRKAEEIRRRLADQEEVLAQKQKEYEQREAALIRRAHEDAEQLIKDARREAEEILAMMRGKLKEQLAQNDLDEARQYQKHLELSQQELNKGKQQYQVKPPGLAPAKIVPGMSVFIPKLNQKGQVLESPDGQEEVLVQAGIMKIKVKRDELRAAEEEAGSGGGAVVRELVSQKSGGISAELDLRGLTAGEAFEKVDKYLDDAVLAGLNQVRLIHGKGTGALRAALKNWLREHLQVEEFYLADERHGGSGVTEVKLKG